MARLIAVVLFLTLVLAPVVSAGPQDRGESPFAGWFDAIQSALDRVFSWIPTIRSETGEAGAMLIPTGLQSVPNGIQAAPRKAGAMLIPTGITANPGLPELRGPAETH